MGEEFTSKKPIYLQIVDRICKQVVTNKLRVGDKLPSVREMAIKVGVNPNTVQRTYNEMERLGLLESRRGQGTFVTENQQIISDLKVRLQAELIECFIREMEELGYKEEEIIVAVQEHLRGDTSDH